MNLSELKKAGKSKKRRLGQGHGSGRVKTSGRGTKGQKARNHVKISFEGGAIPLIKRLPFIRGRANNKSFKGRPIALNIEALNSLPAKTVVTEDLLVKKGLVGKDEIKNGVKILGDGKLTVALTVNVLVSKKAKGKIEKAGGILGSK